MSTKPAARVWPVMSFRDASAAIDFLCEAFRLEVANVYRRQDDPSIVEHADKLKCFGHREEGS